jgi:hypothetical protein
MNIQAPIPRFLPGTRVRFREYKTMLSGDLTGETGTVISVESFYSVTWRHTREGSEPIREGFALDHYKVDLDSGKKHGDVDAYHLEPIDDDTLRL